MRSVFVTGAAGFLGGYVCAAFLEAGWSVLALIHRSRSERLELLNAQGGLRIIQGDICEHAALELSLREALKEEGGRLDAIVHAAGRVSDVGRESQFRRTNFEAVQGLTALSLALEVPRFLFVSTTDVYGLRDFQGEDEETLPLENNTGNLYPEYKIRAERWIRDQLPPSRFVILRPAAIWGLGDQTLTPRIIDFLRGSPWRVHFGPWRGENRWPLAHVRNVAAALLLAATQEEALGQAINVLDSEHTSVDEFYRLIAQTYLGRSPKPITLPLALGKALGWLISQISSRLGQAQPFMDPSLYAVQSVSSNLDFSNRRCLALFKAGGYQAISRDEGLQELRRSLA